jgi:tRNA dimethylallyltransferase
MKHNKILITGVTASGKSSLAFELAKILNGEIISVDSMKVYKRMDIGTAKSPAEKRKQIPYHLIDVVEPSEPFSVAAFIDLTQKSVDQIHSQNKNVIAVGGTALYIKALLYGLFEGPGTDPDIREKLKNTAQTIGLDALYLQLKKIDPVAAERIHPNDSKRIIRALEVYQLTNKTISSFQTQFESKPDTTWTVIGLKRIKEDESHRVNQRVKKMVDLGLLDEVKNLLTETKPLSPQAACAIGYAEIIEHLKGNMTLEQAVEKIKINTRRFAKHQRTWFKRFATINWIHLENDDTPQTVLQKTLDILNP